MDNSSSAESVRMPYEKPRLRTIELAAEEVLSAGCKVDGSTAGRLPFATCTTGHCGGLGS